MVVRNLGLSVIAIAILIALAIGMSATGGTVLLAIIIPYAAFALFLIGFVHRILLWAKSPVPFRITTTCGQQTSLPWIKNNPIESPANLWGVIGRVALEVLLFRSLFRNTDVKIAGGRPVTGSAKWLWFFGLLFHWSLLIIVFRHLRFFSEPIALWINGLAALDGFFEIGSPTFYLSDVALVLALAFLILRRVAVPQIGYISLVADWFALLLILGIATTGLLMRHLFPADLLQVKGMAMGWITLAPTVPKVFGTTLAIHLCFVFTLLAWFPFSKLMHMGGIILSPTRNLANDNRMRRHLNPWNYPVAVHTYEEYEDEFREKMKLAGLPLEKD